MLPKIWARNVRTILFHGYNEDKYLSSKIGPLQEFYAEDTK